jgi:pilus assembly protein Flp/PilA
MVKVMELVHELKRDEEGAALVEYTVLLGILLIAVIGAIGTVGVWVGNKWTVLSTTLT